MWHYTERGAGRPLILLHGIGMSGSAWNSVTPYLSPTRRVVTFDIAGFGLTPPLPRGIPPTSANLAVALEQSVRAMGMDVPVDIAGNSLGGLIALEAARPGAERSCHLPARPLERSRGISREVPVQNHAGSGRERSCRPAGCCADVLPPRTGTRRADLGWKSAHAGARGHRRGRRTLGGDGLRRYLDVHSRAVFRTRYYDSSDRRVRGSRLDSPTGFSAARPASVSHPMDQKESLGTRADVDRSGRSR
jgi:pimeloyl-ACP methyl ester carboxylesterase